MQDPFDRTLPCFICGNPISKEAEVCPHCGQPDAGVESALINTRELAQEYERHKAETKTKEREARLKNLPVDALVVLFLFLGFPFLGFLMLSVVVELLFDVDVIRWFLGLFFD